MSNTRQRNSCAGGLFQPYVCTIAVALGDGVRDVGRDIAYGIERGFESLGGKGERRIISIGNENEYLFINIKNVFKTSVTAYHNPLTKLIGTILLEYYSFLPDDVLSLLVKKTGESALKASGKQLGKTLGKKLATKIAIKVAKRIASTTAMKKLGKKVGVSAALSTTGIGIPVSGVMYLGLAQKASKASLRLRASHPNFWKILRDQEGLDMLYFLVEEPMKDHISFIAGAAKDTKRSKIYIEKLKSQLSESE